VAHAEFQKLKEWCLRLLDGIGSDELISDEAPKYMSAPMYARLS